MFTKEEMITIACNGGNSTKKNKSGIFAANSEMRSIWASTNGTFGRIRQRDEKLGMFGRSKEQWSEDSRKAGRIGGSIVGSMFWWNNGSMNKKSYTSPGNEWVRGQIKTKKDNTSHG
jgi:hypothetical protein